MNFKYPIILTKLQWKLDEQVCRYHFRFLCQWRIGSWKSPIFLWVVIFVIFLGWDWGGNLSHIATTSQQSHRFVWLWFWFEQNPNFNQKCCRYMTLANGDEWSSWSMRWLWQDKIEELKILCPFVFFAKSEFFSQVDLKDIRPPFAEAQRCSTWQTC